MFSTFQDHILAKHAYPSPLAECLNPYGLEAKCLPFTISPFALIDMCLACPNAKSKAMSDGEIIIPSTLKFDIFAAFPVMIPLYAAEYTIPAIDGEPEHTYSLYVHASGSTARLAGVLPLPRGLKLPRYSNPENPGYIDIDEYPMHDFVELVSSLPALRTDDDVCIRSLTEEEYHPLDRYITVSKTHNRMFDVDTQSWPRAAIRDFEAKKLEDRRRADEYLPSWWSESKYSCSTTRKKREPAKKEKPLRSRSSPI
ncbi:hypothetical protein HYPSUDRAFT_40981 [Hypholoma sublateritium FD-334 SS-4]|uniref:Uncharacterized protein n=1 Tax=Hypholoma sublateritium (strain FD-334 SS-4) TaxID=945553 RepID=A0A0D2MG44_HYPSF|nr:hypothetical protein HYPSUDRAFT_40981 [Hypholoma sublateritium FD-334 SS-4]